MAEEHKEIDRLTGTATTGHEWDGLKELNTPLPRWWLYMFYATIVWAVGYWLVYPAWPLITNSTQGVFGAHLPAGATSVVAAAAGLRWASSTDLVRALEQCGVVAIVRAADREGAGDRVEVELFAFGRTVVENPDLRSALSDPARSVADKQALVRSLLSGKAHAGTVLLVEQAASGAHLTLTNALDGFVELAASTRGRLVALVRVAQQLDEDEEKRLAAALSAQYDKTVHLNTVVDPSVLGGIHVSIGDEVIDGTVSSRLDEASRRLAG